MRQIYPFQLSPSPFDALIDDLFLPLEPRANEFRPAIHVDKRSDSYLMSLDLPGFKKENIHIEINEGCLSVSGERQRDRSDEKFERRFSLPENTDEDRIEANYEDGVLHLVLPKLETKKNAKKIEIQTGASGFFNRILKASPTQAKSPDSAH